MEDEPFLTSTSSRLFISDRIKNIDYGLQNLRSGQFLRWTHPSLFRIYQSVLYTFDLDCDVSYVDRYVNLLGSFVSGAHSLASLYDRRVRDIESGIEAKADGSILKARGELLGSLRDESCRMLCFVGENLERNNRLPALYSDLAGLTMDMSSAYNASLDSYARFNKDD